MPLALREATLADVPFLLGIWQDSLRLADPADQIGDLEQVIKESQTSPDRRLVVAEYDGERAGAVLLVASTISPLNREPTVHVLALHVTEDYQRRGVGQTLMDAAVGFAEERGIGHLAAAAAWSSRDGNRYLARLGFGPHGVFRAVGTKTVRQKLTAQRPAVPRARAHLGQVLAARRSMRRSQPVG